MNLISSNINKFQISRVYYQHNWEINHNYTKSTKEHFLAGPEKVDFSIGTAPAIINKWIEDQTNDKIKDLVPADLDPSTVLVLVNAIHFKGDWDEKFNDAIEDDFHVSENNTVKAQMMTNSESKYGYLSLDEVKAQAVEIPYKGKQISMIVILPNRDSSLEELEAALDVSDLKNFDTRKVDLTLPKFKIETSLDLIDALKNMGMKDMFNPSLADFSKMGHPDSGKIYVSDGKKSAGLLFWFLKRWYGIGKLNNCPNVSKMSELLAFLFRPLFKTKIVWNTV